MNRLSDEWFTSKSEKVPLWHKIALSIDETYVYTGIGKQFLENDNPEVLLPHFSCHSLRHTFTTRMCEAGVNVKVIQDALGHKDVSTTLNIYTDVTKELRKSEFEGLELQFNQ